MAAGLVHTASCVSVTMHGNVPMANDGAVLALEPVVSASFNQSNSVRPNLHYIYMEKFSFSLGVVTPSS